jgi:hypothetical protein
MAQRKAAQGAAAISEGKNMAKSVPNRYHTHAHAHMREGEQPAAPAGGRGGANPYKARSPEP